MISEIEAGDYFWRPREVFTVKFDKITIDEVRAGTTALFDQQKNPVEGGFILSLYRDGKEVGSIVGKMIQMEKKQKIPPFTVDFFSFSK